MSENQNRGYVKYDSMATEELEEILRLDAEAPEGQASDGEEILYVMEVLAQRKRNSDNPGKTAHEAWGSFEKNYLPKEEEEHTAKQKKSVKKSCRWLPRLMATAAVIAILVGIPLTASAFGWEDIWNAVANWAKETFSFVSGDSRQITEPSGEDSLQFTSLQQALAETNIPSDMVPTWIPEGYILKDITVDENPMQRAFIAYYSNGEKPLRISVQAFLLADPEKIEINENLIEAFEVSGVEYYVFANMDQTQIIWIKDSYQCIVSGDLTIEEIKMMIDSIGKG